VSISQLSVWNAEKTTAAAALDRILGYLRLRTSLRVFTDMGDKSPKTKNKQAAQKQAKASAAAKQKNANKAAGQAVKPKR
jgi:hypothetical protein